jgi:hypothetical protein
MGQVVSAVPHEGGAHSASYSRLPETFTEIKQTKRQADSPSPSRPGGGGGENGKITGARPSGRGPGGQLCFICFCLSR